MVYLCSYTFATSQAIVTVANGASTGFLRTNSIKLVPEVSVDYFVCTGSMGYGGSLYGEVGTWSTAGGGYSGYGRNPERTSSSPNAQATFTPQVPVEGLYHAYIYNDPGLPSTAGVSVTSHSSLNATCNGLTKTGTQDWIYLGDYYFGTDNLNASGGVPVADHISVTDTTSLSVSAIKLTYASERSTASKECSNN
jgi:hypothetical protein